MDLSSLPHELDKKKKQCRVVIETPKGRRNKFDYDSKIAYGLETQNAPIQAAAR
jgi:inorganic pyrophosphatase